MGRDTDDFEINRSAKELLKVRGMAAMGYARQKIETLGIQGDEEKQAYWRKISQEIDNLLFEEGKS